MDCNYDNRCVWYDIFVCPDVECYHDFGKCEECTVRISTDSPEGKAVYDKYTEDIETATTPIYKKWRKVMESERMMRENL